MNIFKKAERKKVKIKIAISGPSGSGKTYSALRMAKGLAPTGKIALLDTEGGRASLYSEDFDFDTIEISRPFSPQKYKSIIDDAVNNEYEVLVIDSMSHEWQYVLDEKEKKDKTGKSGNSFTNWAEFKAIHNRFIQQVLESDIHIIATYRAKAEYVMQENARGKSVPKKVGMGIQGQANDEYEYTIHMEMSLDGNLAEATKDNTRLFENKVFQPSEDDGKLIFEWLSTGKERELTDRQIIDKIVFKMQQQTNEMKTLEEKRIYWASTLSMEPNDLIKKTNEELKALLEFL